eukprot:TRINITY_DN21177_c0_g1_i1.p1 TRINITY_DN21177_c0_g1~~TRINITY_DN21177_c0_g1_i1.p1  ORF type:complete len:204 (+),score=56.84 TRINITY_DN21177_c0_g1_i1:51-614(+)
MGITQIKGVRADSFSVAAPINVVFDKLCDARVWFAAFPTEDRAPRVELLDPGNARGKVPGEGAVFSVLQNETALRTQHGYNHTIAYTEQVEGHQKVTLASYDRPAQITYRLDAAGGSAATIFHLTSTSQNRTNVTCEIDTYYVDQLCGCQKSCATSQAKLATNQAASKLQMILSKELGNGFDTRGMR